MSKRDAWAEGYQVVAREYNARLAREAQLNAKIAKAAKAK